MSFDLPHHCAQHVACDVGCDSEVGIHLDRLVHRHFVDVLGQLGERFYGHSGLQLGLVGQKHAMCQWF